MRAKHIKRSFLLGAVAFGTAALFGQGCGGDDSTTTNSVDGGTTDALADNTQPPIDAPADLGTTTDTGQQQETGTDTGTGVDAGADANDGGTGCGADNTPCSNGGANGLCKSNVCSPCTDPTDDSNCKTAYGGAGNPFLCLAGTCTKGDCRATTDCAANPNGSICGVTTPNFCGKCSTDQQCPPANPVCNTGTGVCGTAVCAVVNNTPCAQNPTDVCCGALCVAGNCCDTPSCVARLGNGYTCSLNHVCTQCDPVVGLNPVFIVDPVNGNDQSATGSGKAGGAASASCAFKTITRALAVIGTAAAGTKISITGPSTVSAGETFPIIVPLNVTITTNTGAVTVQVPANRAGFLLQSAASGIQGGAGAALTIDGQTNTASNGVVVNTGSTDGTRIQDVTIQNFLNDGILVGNAGILGIVQGVSSTGNGTANARRNGLHVTGTSHSNINVPSGSTPTSFGSNSGFGILVDAQAFVAITGSVTNASTGTGTVTANGNVGAGLRIQQQPGIAALPRSTITGLVTFGSTNGHGMHFHCPSNVKLRNSVALANVSGNGVRVSTQLLPGGVRNNDMSKMDLGNAASVPPDYGNNTLQASIGANPNGAAGICIEVDPNAGALLGAGNTFHGGVNCATTAGSLLINNTGCGNGGCAGNICDLGRTNLLGNDITVSQCTHP